jgi:antitoxin (DNA-binding transcriptional repressor) of toxin-antitoxin stability system
LARVMAGQAEPIRIGASELRAKLARYLREASQGRRFLIVLRGVAMAELGPPSSPSEDRKA